MKEKKKKSIFKKWWFWIIVVIIIVIGFSGNDDESKPSSSTQPDSGTSDNIQQQDEVTEKLYSIGESVVVGNLEFVVNNFEETTEITSNNMFIDSITTQGKLVVIDATVKNNDKESRTIHGTMFKLIDDQGREFDTLNSGELMMILGDANIFLEKVNPGLSVNGVFVFEIPADVESYSLELASGVAFAGGKVETVKLK